jgi:hypothetical protein
VQGQREQALFVPWYADDIVFGGLGGDFLHGGAGDDAMSGAEALRESYAPIYRMGTPATSALGAGLVRTDWERPYNPSFYTRAATGAVTTPSGFTAATIPAGVLGYGVVRAGDLAMYDEYDGMRLIVFNANGTAGPADGCSMGSLTGTGGPGLPALVPERRPPRGSRCARAARRPACTTDPVDRQAVGRRRRPVRRPRQRLAGRRHRS